MRLVTHLGIRIHHLLFKVNYSLNKLYPSLFRLNQFGWTGQISLVGLYIDQFGWTVYRVVWLDCTDQFGWIGQNSLFDHMIIVWLDWVDQFGWTVYDYSLVVLSRLVWLNCIQISLVGLGRLEFGWTGQISLVGLYIEQFGWIGQNSLVGLGRLVWLN